MLSTKLSVKLLGAKQCAPAISEVLHIQKRCESTLDFHQKLGSGGRSSFSGVVATVFGSNGMLGKYVVNRLGREGCQLVLPHRCDEYYVKHLKLMGDLGQVMFQDFHLRDEESVYKSLQYSNVAINLIGSDYATRNFTLEETHTEGAETIARLAKEAGIKRFVHVSALGADENSPSEFLRTKALGEAAVKRHFPAATIMRPAQIYSHEDRYLNMYAYMRNVPFGVPLIGNGKNTIKRPVYIVDVARAIIMAVENESCAGQTYELYGPFEHYLYDLVEYIFRVIRRPFRSLPIPEPVFRAIAWGLEQSFFDPRLTRDMMYRQFMSEVPTGALSFDDLGISPVTVDETAIALLRRHRTTYEVGHSIDEIEPCRRVAV